MPRFDRNWHLFVVSIVLVLQDPESGPFWFLDVPALERPIYDLLAPLKKVTVHGSELLFSKKRISETSRA